MTCSAVGRDTTNDRVALFRIQVAALPGNGRFQVVGVSAKAVKESARMAFDYLRANAKRVGLDRDLGAYDFNIQVMSPTHGKDTADLGVAFYIAILSAIVNKPIAGSLVVMGQMSIHGVLSRVEQLGDRLRVTMDAGARQVLIPTVNAADSGRHPARVAGQGPRRLLHRPFAGRVQGDGGGVSNRSGEDSVMQAEVRHSSIEPKAREQQIAEVRDEFHEIREMLVTLLTRQGTGGRTCRHGPNLFAGHEETA